MITIAHLIAATLMCTYTCLIIVAWNDHMNALLYYNYYALLPLPH